MPLHSHLLRRCSPPRAESLRKRLKICSHINNIIFEYASGCLFQSPVPNLNCIIKSCTFKLSACEFTTPSLISTKNISLYKNYSRMRKIKITVFSHFFGIFSSLALIEKLLSQSGEYFRHVYSSMPVHCCGL